MARWKQVERDLAKWIGDGGRRQPSQGTPEADVISDNATFECKSRDQKNFPNWILDAFNQAALNKRLYPDKENFVLLSVHFGRGVPMRWFIAKEITTKSDDWESVNLALSEAIGTVVAEMSGSAER